MSDVQEISVVSSTPIFVWFSTDIATDSLSLIYISYQKQRQCSSHVRYVGSLTSPVGCSIFTITTTSVRHGCRVSGIPQTKGTESVQQTINSGYNNQEENVIEILSPYEDSG